MAVDVQGSSKDVFQTAYQVMEHIYLNFEYCVSTTSVGTHANEVLGEKRGFVKTLLMLRLLYVAAWVFLPVM